MKASEVMRTKEWVGNLSVMDNMTVLEAYAETTYEETVVDPGERGDMAVRIFGDDEETVRVESMVVDAMSELDRIKLSPDKVGEKVARHGSIPDVDAKRGSGDLFGVVSESEEYGTAPKPVLRRVGEGPGSYTSASRSRYGESVTNDGILSALPKF